MPRFQVPFGKRKSNQDDSEHVDDTPPVQPSFRVLERDEVTASKSGDGPARMARAPVSHHPKDYDEFEENMFASLKTNNRGSGLSNITHPTYTDNSSRHSNASTAPSSADFSGGNLQDEHRVTSSKTSSPEATARASSSKSLGSKFLGKAGRTFSFGNRQKNLNSSPKEEPLPEIPPLALKSQAPLDRARGLVGSTMTIAKMEADPIDLGTDFRSMVPQFDKRASLNATPRKDDLASPRVLTGNRPLQSGQPVPPSPVMANPADPLLSPWSTDQYESRPDSPLFDSPPPLPPPHQKTTRPGSAARPRAARRDEESELLEESFDSVAHLVTSNKFASGSHSGRGFQREEESFSVTPRKQPAPAAEEEDDDDNLFEGSSTRLPKPAQRYAPPKPANPPRNKVMTPAEFERYRDEKVRQDTAKRANREAGADSDSEEEINYDDDEDEAEKSREQSRMRRKQEAHMAVYRQQMMKVTGETAPPATAQPGRPGLPSSMSAPQLSQMKGPQPLSAGVSDGDEDEEIPLAILQAHGFPNKNRPPARLNNMASNPNLRVSMHSQMGSRPLSIVGDAGANRRHSTLPAFARGLPPDPFSGAGIARPAVRESLLFNDTQHHHKSSPSMPPGGLVGVIANEERSRALRRGSPSVDATRLLSGGGLSGSHSTVIDPVMGMPHHMMYNQAAMRGGGMQGMMPSQMMQQPSTQPLMQQQPMMMQQQLMQQQMMQQQMMQQSMMLGGDQAQMTQSLPQLMQMQYKFMQMMGNTPGSGQPQQHFMGMPGNNSMMNLSSARNSYAFDPAMESRRADYNARTMSMVQPSSAPMVNPGYAGSVRSSMHGYAPSVAPSERSNVGLPHRYRPVSSVAGPSGHARSHTMGATSTKPAMRVVNKSASASDDDDEQGWEAMKVKREKRRSLWKSQKGVSTVV